jgi:Uma2 family endonuclease
MTSDAFLAWAMDQPEGTRYELHAGVVVAMAPERSIHALIKLHVTRRLAEAVERQSLPCQVYPDGMAVEVDDTTTYEPDALVRCGPPPPQDTIKFTDPPIVVEVLSPSSRTRDNGTKLINYFRLPSVQHYLIVPTDDRAIIHHARNPDGTILTRVVRGDTLHLDPPGLTVTDLFLSTPSPEAPPTPAPPAASHAASPPRGTPPRAERSASRNAPSAPPTTHHRACPV